MLTVQTMHQKLHIDSYVNLNYEHKLSYLKIQNYYNRTLSWLEYLPWSVSRHYARKSVHHLQFWSSHQILYLDNLLLTEQRFHLHP